MHAVEHYELIRRKHFVDGMSQRAIAEELGHSRKFVKKALQHPIPPGYQLTKSKPKPTLDPVQPLIDAWLEEDLTRPVKQRHTAQRIYERLVDEKDFRLFRRICGRILAVVGCQGCDIVRFRRLFEFENHRIFW